MIRLIENATGRRALIRRATGYERDLGPGRDFWQVLVERYALEVSVVSGATGTIPREGPLVIVANHPFGVLDGLVLGHLLSETRADFRILANHVFLQTDALRPVILPVDFDGTAISVATNLATRQTALSYLAAGGAIGVFPGGTVSTARRPFGRALDPRWRTFTARLIARTGAAVVPVYFDGANSRMFQLASHLHQTLRLGLLMREFRARVGTPVRIGIGTPVPPDEIGPFLREPRALMDFLRRRTYALSPRPVPALAYGYEFEERARNRART